MADYVVEPDPENPANSRVSLEGVSSCGNTVLHEAVEHNDVELVSVLLRKGADLAARNHSGLTPADLARHKLFTDITRLFQRHHDDFIRWCDGGPPDDRDPLGYSRLMKACHLDNDRAVQLLLQKGANPNTAVPQTGVTALMIASLRGNAIIVSLLLDKGADVNAKSKSGNKACDIAKRMDHDSVVKILKPLTTEHMPQELKALAPGNRPDTKGGYTIRSTVQVRKPSVRLKGDTPFVESSQSTVEASLDQHISSLDEFVKWNGRRKSVEDPQQHQIDLSKLIDLPAEPILGPAREDPTAGSSRAGKSTRVSLNLALADATATAHLKSPRANMIAAFSSQPQGPVATSGANTPAGLSPAVGSPAPVASAAGIYGATPSTGSPSATTPMSPSYRGPSPADPPATPLSQSAKIFLTNALKVIEKMEEEQQFSTERQTALNFTFQTVLSYIRQLITAVNNKFNPQFVDITAMIVHEGGEIMREIKDRFQDHDNVRKQQGGKEDSSDFVQKREKISQSMKGLDQQMQNLALKTKMASGIWPPPNSELEMVEAAVLTAKTSRDLIKFANMLAVFKTVVDEQDKEDKGGEGMKRLDFKEYKRQRNLKLLEEIAQVEKSSVLNDGQDESDDDELRAQDSAFLQDLDVSIKVFVATLVKFKTIKEKGVKTEYLTHANTVVDEALSIAKKVEPKMAALQNVELDSNIYKLKTVIHQLVLGMGTLTSELLTRVNLCRGVWPPPNAEANMMEAALAVAASVKELVNTTKTAVTEYQESWRSHLRSERKSKKDWEKKLLQNAKIEKFDVLVKEEHSDFLEFEQGEVVLTQEEDELLRDNETDGITFDQNVDANKPLVKGGVVEKLVERLTYFKYPDPEYRLAFLLTYQSFTTPLTVFQLLVARFEMGPPPGLSQNQFTLFMEKKIKPTRLRVFNVFKAWIENHFEDWADNSELIAAFRKFVEQRLAVEMKSAAQQLMKLLRDKLDGLKRQTTLTYGDNVEMPRPLLPKQCHGSLELENFLKNDEARNWIHVDPLEMARQVTVIEFSMYEKIQAKECIGQAWNGKKKHVLSPNISNCIQFTNQLSAWVATKILDSEDIRVRVATLKYFIMMAQRCLELNNFNSATSIHAALESSAVHRLKKSWEKFNTDKQNKQLVLVYEGMCSLFSPKGNYSNYRKHLHTINPPVVPYLGVYLTDLTFIEDGNGDFLPAPLNHMVNFDKRRKISKSITEIKMYQQIPYFLMDVAQIQDFLLSVQGLDEKLLYQRSLVVEPKEEQPS